MPFDVENLVVIAIFSNIIGFLVYMGFNVGEILKYFYDGGMLYLNFLREP